MEILIRKSFHRFSSLIIITVLVRNYLIGCLYALSLFFMPLNRSFISFARIKAVYVHARLPVYRIMRSLWTRRSTDETSRVGSRSETRARLLCCFATKAYCSQATLRGRRIVYSECYKELIQYFYRTPIHDTIATMCLCFITQAKHLVTSLEQDTRR